MNIATEAERYGSGAQGGAATVLDSWQPHFPRAPLRHLQPMVRFVHRCIILQLLPVPLPLFLFFILFDLCRTKGTLGNIISNLFHRCFHTGL